MTKYFGKDIELDAQAARETLAAYINASTDFHLRWMRRGFQAARDDLSYRHGYWTPFGVACRMGVTPPVAHEAGSTTL